MTQKEFMVIAAAIKTYYPKENILPTKEAVSLWYDCLNDLEFAKAQAALKNYTKSNSYPPAIADIRNEYGKIIDKEAKAKAELRRLYDMTVSYYPCANREKDVESTYKSLISQIKPQDRLEAAKTILQKVLDFVKEWEKGTDNDIITLTDFLKGLDVNELCH